MRVDDEGGDVAHAELLLGDAAILVFSDAGPTTAGRRDDAIGYGIYLAVADDVDAVWTRSVEAVTTRGLTSRNATMTNTFAVSAAAVSPPGTDGTAPRPKRPACRPPSRRARRTRVRPGA